MFIKNDIKSSTIKAIAYDPDEKKLWLTFKSENLYEYNDVEREIADALVEAESKGKYFNQNIKDKYTWVKVEE